MQKKLFAELSLNIKLFTPLHTSAFRDAVMGEMPGIDDPRHEVLYRTSKT